MWNYDFTVPESKRIRVIVHTDCKNEADDQFALAHHLMTPKFDVRGIIAGHFASAEKYRDFGGKNTVEASYDEVLKILELMGLAGRYPVAKGSPKPMINAETPPRSEGADMIIQEAMRDDPKPLYVAFLGAITDLAAAYLIEPRIAKRLTAIWIGGGTYPEGCREFNLGQDIQAANVVFSSDIPLWQVPMDVYKQMAVSLAELQMRVKPCGAIGEYLFRQMVEFNEQFTNPSWPWPHGEIWGLGDSPTISVLMEEAERTTSYELRPAPQVDGEMRYVHNTGNREIRVYKHVDARLTMEDFYAKLHLNFFGADKTASNESDTYLK